MQLQLKNLSFTYGAGSAFEKKALKNINIKVEQSEFVAIIGHTGSGKSTLIQHFNGLLKPTAGEVLINGEDIYKDKGNLVKIRQEVGLLFQYPEYQLFETTIFKDVCFGPKNMGLKDEEIKDRATKALNLVGIHEKDFEKSPFELSGGQKRRVAMAGVLALEPKILVLDEPTAGLDPQGRDEILGQIKKMQNELDMSIILVSHSMEDVAKLAERIIVISDGEIVRDGSVKEVFKEVKYLESIGLAAPSISYLMYELKEKGFDVPLDVYTVEEAQKIISNILKAGEK